MWTAAAAAADRGLLFGYEAPERRAGELLTESFWERSNLPGSFSFPNAGKMCTSQSSWTNFIYSHEKSEGEINGVRYKFNAGELGHTMVGFADMTSNFNANHEYTNLHLYARPDDSTYNRGIIVTDNYVSTWYCEVGGSPICTVGYDVTSPEPWEFEVSLSGTTITYKVTKPDGTPLFEQVSTHTVQYPVRLAMNFYSANSCISDVEIF